MELYSLNQREVAKEISAYLGYFLNEHLKHTCDNSIYQSCRILTEPYLSPNVDNGSHLFFQPTELSKKYLARNNKFQEIESSVNLRIFALSNEKVSAPFQILPKIELLALNALKQLNGMNSLFIVEKETVYNRDQSGSMNVCHIDMILECRYRNYYEIISMSSL